MKKLIGRFYLVNFVNNKERSFHVLNFEYGEGFILGRRVLEKVQPICVVCRQQMWKDDMVQVDKLFDHFTHFHCYELDKIEIKEIGKFGEIVKAKKKYKKLYLVQWKRALLNREGLSHSLVRKNQLTF